MRRKQYGRTRNKRQYKHWKEAEPQVRDGQLCQTWPLNSVPTTLGRTKNAYPVAGLISMASKYRPRL